MNFETRTCQNCKSSFTIEPEDFDFYTKIQVPSPTWCPECRFIRRTIWRNDRILYRRKDDRTGKMIFSAFPEEAPIVVWDRDDWWTDLMNPIEYGREYDWNKPFFEQMKRLLSVVPLPSRSVVNLVRSDYCMNANNLKDCYLVFASAFAEHSFYSLNLADSQDVFDSGYLNACQVAYEGLFNAQCSRIFFSSFCESCMEVWFSKNCVGCANCFGCVGLRKKQYHIFNKPYDKDEYFEKIKEFNIGSYESFQKVLRQAKEFWQTHPVKYIEGYRNNGVSGQYISNSKNVKYSYHINNGENLKYCQDLYFKKPARDSYDHFRFGEGSELVYETAVSGLNVSRIKFCADCYVDCSDMEYSIACRSSSNLFGCIGTQKKQYCILNKEYSKEEYQKLVPKIKAHMDAMPYHDAQKRTYKYGEFFPPDFSPLAYNETVAQEFFPLTETEAQARGFRWAKLKNRDYNPTLKNDKIPDHIRDVPDSIKNEVIECGHGGACAHNCTVAFKIVPDELQFLRTMQIPLPRLCVNCRFSERLLQRMPYKFYKRKCACNGSHSENHLYENESTHSHLLEKCPNEFETSYAPDRPEIVYCEQCYQAEVA